jgi:hypothetical protein
MSLVKILFLFELTGELFSYFIVLSLACECVMRRERAVRRFFCGEDLKTLSNCGSCERHVSLVIPALSYMNVHLITVFTFLLELILTGSY